MKGVAVRSGWCAGKPTRAKSTDSEAAAESPFREALAGWNRTSPVLPPGDYAELLFRKGGSNITVFEKVYPHVLANTQAVCD